jgi:hypothetical protein
MEGFLWKKARGEGGVLSRRNWKKRWFVLEGQVTNPCIKLRSPKSRVTMLVCCFALIYRAQYLFYYENFDREIGEPVNRKGAIPVRGCTFHLAQHRERQNCFVIKHNGE